MNSFESAPKLWLAELDKFAVGDVCKMLIGTKSDLENKRVKALPLPPSIFPSLTEMNSFRL